MLESPAQSMMLFTPLPTTQHHDHVALVVVVVVVVVVVAIILMGSLSPLAYYTSQFLTNKSS